MIALAQRRIDEAEASLCREWHGIRDPAALAGTLAAEHMRALLYGATAARRGVGAVPSIHTARLLAIARQTVELLWPQYAHRPPTADICAVALDQMEAIGDAVDTGSGQWLAAPLRIVTPKDGSCYLLVGGAPAQAVYRTLGVPPTCAGTSQFVGTAVFEAEGNRDLVVSVDSWFGHQQPLAAWTAQGLSHYEGRMDVVEGLSAEHLELYAPDVIQAQRRSGRWIAAGQIGRSLDGLRLCRPQDRYARNWDRPYYLALFGFKDGELTLRRTAPVSRDLTLRLCFGLDIMLQTPRRVSIVLQRDTFWIGRPLMLPQPEARVYALGWKHPAQDNPDRLAFHADALPFVVHALQRLAITPTVTSGGRRQPRHTRYSITASTAPSFVSPKASDHILRRNTIYGMKA